MRICSLVPAATEIVYALGAGHQVVAVSHECDFPTSVKHKPKATRSVVDQERFGSREIDELVRAALRERQALYELDETVLREAAPDLIITQALCEVCAIDTSAVVRTVRLLGLKPNILSLRSQTLSGLFEEIHVIGEAVGCAPAAEQLVASYRRRIGAVTELTGSTQARPRVCCIEWFDPPMSCGHWVPEMVDLAGGYEVLGRVGERSHRLDGMQILSAQPEIVVLMPCGFSIERARRELPVLEAQSWWRRLTDSGAAQVFLVDGPAYFHRCGPRAIDGIELLAALLFPERCGSFGIGSSAERLSLAKA